jgi:hypothetical protein
MRPGMGVAACIEADLPHLFAEEFMPIGRVQSASFRLQLDWFLQRRTLSPRQGQRC